MNAAKIRLSQKEMELVTNADWILTKNSILQKSIQLLAAIQRKQQEYLQQYGSTFPQPIMESSPKISKGENYKGLPYQVLDHPRVFEQEDIFTIRTMFWWGNFFSVTVQCSGKYQELFAEKIIGAYDQLHQQDFSYCISDDQWEHHFEETNYLPLSLIDKVDWERMMRNKSFLKLSSKVTLSQWNDAEEILFGHFKFLLGLLI